MRLVIWIIAGLLTIPTISAVAQSVTVDDVVVPEGYILVPETFPEQTYKEGIRMACMYRMTRYWLAEGAGDLAPEIAAKKCKNYAKKVTSMYGDFVLDIPDVVPTPRSTWGRGYWRSR